MGSIGAGWLTGLGKLKKVVFINMVGKAGKE